jgi:DNA-binding response OmpR family regulator
MPVMMLGIGWTEAEALIALEAGASDYMAREVSIELLSAKLLVHLRQYERSDRAVLPIGGLVFHPARRLLVAPLHHRRAVLTAKEAAILKALYDAGEQGVTRTTLLDEVWGYSSRASTHTIQTHIHRLRRRLEVELGEADLIITCGPGYRLRTRPGSTTWKSYGGGLGAAWKHPSADRARPHRGSALSRHGRSGHRTSGDPASCA